MLHPFFDFFNKDRPYVPPDPSKWPPAWKTIQWKSYERFPAVFLPTPQKKNFNLRDVLSARRSRRDFSRQPLLDQEMSDLLFYSCGLIHRENKCFKHRTYPSGGGLYPLEVYLLIFWGTRAISRGAYHYNLLGHYLEKLPVADVHSLGSLFSYPRTGDASAVFLFSFVEERVKSKYGNFSYKLGLIESGHMGQNLVLNAAAMGLKCCPLGNLNAEAMNQALGLDGVNETVFYPIAAGK